MSIDRFVSSSSVVCCVCVVHAVRAIKKNYVESSISGLPVQKRPNLAISSFKKTPNGKPVAYQIKVMSCWVDHK